MIKEKTYIFLVCDICEETKTKFYIGLKEARKKAVEAEGWEIRGDNDICPKCILANKKA